VFVEPASDLLDLRGRRAVVTGGAVGIGAAIVERLASAGAEVLLADVDDVGRATAEILTGRDLSVRFLRCDITDPLELAAAAEAGASGGPLDIWVNNAGIYPATGPVVDVADDFLVRMLDVNVRAQLSAVREAARRMTAGGSIVNLASISGLRGGAGISAYSTSKAAVIGMTRALAVELGPAGIRVNAVAPGIIDTPGVQAQLAPLQAAGIDVERRISANPLGLAGKPHHVADVCLFLVSDLAAFVTGVTLVADGGSSL
jgi:2-deoxy-D-gluconate 3-dehydrogenase